MGLVVEDGSGVDSSPSANSYATVAEATAYFADRNNTDWSGASSTAQAAALIQATDYMVQQYRERWKGVRVSSGQPLDWPRYGVIIEDTYRLESQNYPSSAIGLPNEIAATVLPIEIKNACIELALRLIEDTTTKLTADLDRGGALKRVKAGSVEVEYFEGADPERLYPAVERAIRPFLKATSAFSRKLRRA
jgi:hypothetical protein